ncbi:hypothetical protein EDC04DRAFT_2886859 [Pisolithus marmoratus]|nr:hypothetical protein EDC04DRAFT_2886859 [Pisolithus marmoratus]
MDNANLHDVELVWPHTGPNDVIATGTFDQWSASIHLVKGDAGFHGTVKLPWGEKVAYKFIVDGYWFCRDDRPMEDDGSEIASVPEATHPPEPNGVAPIVPMIIVPVNDVASEGRPLSSEVETLDPGNLEQPNGPSTHTPEIPHAQSEAVIESLAGMSTPDMSEGTKNQSSKPLNTGTTPVVSEPVSEHRAAPTDSAPSPSHERHTSLPPVVQQNASSAAPSMESSVIVKKKRLSIFEKLKRVFHKGHTRQPKA